MRLTGLLAASALAVSVAVPSHAQEDVSHYEPETLTQAQLARIGNEVLRQVRDPSSVIWGDISTARAYRYDGTSYLVSCGLVNAKNGYGGYTGMQGYWVSDSEQAFTVVMGELGRSLCDFYFGM